MNSELTVAESCDSLWSLLQSSIVNFFDPDACECPHRLLDLIVKERVDRRCRLVVGCAFYAVPLQCQAHFTALVAAALTGLACSPRPVSEAAL